MTKAYVMADLMGGTMAATLVFGLAGMKVVCLAVRKAVLTDSHAASPRVGLLAFLLAALSVDLMDSKTALTKALQTVGLLAFLLAASLGYLWVEMKAC